jgi:toxin ParE1/3/4
MAYRLSREADEDFVCIYPTSAAQFGVAQPEDHLAALSRIFDFLGDYPRAARERVEIDPPVRAHPYKSHIIVYRIEGDDIVITARPAWPRRLAF